MRGTFGHRSKRNCKKVKDKIDSMNQQISCKKSLNSKQQSLRQLAEGFRGLSKNMKQRFILILLLILTAAGLNAQVFPVHTITNVSAPYPVSLEQFAEIGNEHISLTIIPNDIKLQNYPIKLRLVI